MHVDIYRVPKNTAIRFSSVNYATLRLGFQRFRASEGTRRSWTTSKYISPHVTLPLFFKTSPAVFFRGQPAGFLFHMTTAENDNRCRKSHPWPTPTPLVGLVSAAPIRQRHGSNPKRPLKANLLLHSFWPRNQSTFTRIALPSKTISPPKRRSQFASQFLSCRHSP